MSATRRGFLGWLAALFSGCYAARDTEAADCVRVTSLRAENGWQPVEAEPVCEVAGYVPPDEYVHGVTPGWTFKPGLWSNVPPSEPITLFAKSHPPMRNYNVAWVGITSSTEDKAPES